MASLGHNELIALRQTYGCCRASVGEATLKNMDKQITSVPVLILGLRPANERRRYKVTPSLIGWAQT